MISFSLTSKQTRSGYSPSKSKRTRPLKWDWIFRMRKLQPTVQRSQAHSSRPILTRPLESRHQALVAHLWPFQQPKCHLNLTVQIGLQHGFYRLYQKLPTGKNFCRHLREGKRRRAMKSSMLGCARSIPRKLNATGCFSSFFAISIISTARNQ